jgi:hypothetical protein
MQRVSLRTLALMVELLVAIMAFQYTVARPAKADAVWLAHDGLAVTQATTGGTDTTAAL